MRESRWVATIYAFLAMAMVAAETVQIPCLGSCGL